VKTVLSAIWNEFVSKKLYNLAGEKGLNEANSFLFVVLSFNKKSDINITITIFKLQRQFLLPFGMKL